MKFHNAAKKELRIIEKMESCVYTNDGIYHKTKLFNSEGKSMATIEAERN